MAEATPAAREPRYWKITVNPPECSRGAWELYRSTGLAMLGLSGEQGEANSAVRNLKQVCEGDWLVAYTPQEGSYTVGGVGRVTRGYRCETEPFDHPWNGPVRRSVAVEWHAGACSIQELVKDGRFRKGKIPRVFDEILPAEFEAIRERVSAVGAPEGALATLLCEPSETASPAPDQHEEPPPLPSFFVEWAQSAPTPGPADQASAAARADRSEILPEAVRVQLQAPVGNEWPTEAEAAAHQSREAQLLSNFSIPGAGESVLDFGLPAAGDIEAPAGREAHAAPRAGLTVEPFAVRVGTLGWSGVFRREVESGRPCSLLLRGPQYAFLNMAPPDTALRGLRLFALFAIGAVSAPGKEAFRSGATFVFRGRRATGDYEIEVRPRHAVPVFPEPAEASF